MLGTGYNHAHPENSFPRSNLELNYILGYGYNHEDSNSVFLRENLRSKYVLGIPLVYFITILISFMIIRSIPVFFSNSTLYNVYQRNEKFIINSKIIRKILRICLKISLSINCFVVIII